MSVAKTSAGGDLVAKMSVAKMSVAKTSAGGDLVAKMSGFPFGQV